MLFEDKGCTFIAVFGADKYVTNPCLDATICAMRMQKALCNGIGLENFSLGVSFGVCFCRVVGTTSRADYVIMGSEVNMAARLMGKAPNRGTLVSKRVYEFVREYVVCEKSEKIQVKGKDGNFYAYVPIKRVLRPTRRSLSVSSAASMSETQFVHFPSHAWRSGSHRT